MAVSDSKNFELDVNEHIEEAFERCGLEARTGYDLRTAKRSLNLLFAEWANRGINRWTIEQKTIALANGVANYPLGTLTMTVNSTTSFQDGEAITGGTSGATATVSSAVSLEDTQASIDVLSAVTRQNSGTSSQSDLSITRIGRDAYLSLASKRSTGRPVQFYVDRLITPEIKLWPTPDSSSSYELVFDRLRRIDDADTQENTVEVPFRFYPCVSAGLAYYLSVKFAPDKVQLLKAIYEEELQRAMQEDRDRSSLLIAPSLDYYRV